MIRRVTPAVLLAVAFPVGVAFAQNRPIPLDTLRVEVGSRASGTIGLTRSVEVITAGTIASTPARTLSDVLALALGVDIQARSPAQADISLRGTSFEQVLVLVDGVRMSDAQTGHFDLDLTVPLGEIERIEILRGPAAAIYGSDAIGGVVHVITRRPTGRSLRASIEGGSFGTVGLSVSTSTGGPDLAGRLGIETRRADGHRDGTDYETLLVNTAIDAALAGRTLHLDAGYAARDFGARAFYTPPAAPFSEFEKTRTATVAASWLAPQDSRFTLEPRVSYRRHEDDFVLRRLNPSFYQNRHTASRVGGEIVGRWVGDHGTRLVFGVEAYDERLTSRKFDGSPALGDRDEQRAAVFTEAAAGRVGIAVLGAGLRADWHSGFDTFFAPSLSAAVWPAERLRLRASAGRAFRAPSWTERYYIDPANIASPDLDSERAWELEAGAEWASLGTLRLSGAAFYRRADGLIDWARPIGAPTSEPWRTRNVDDAEFHGVEFEAGAGSIQILRWTAAFTLLSFDAENASGLISKAALRPLDRTAILGAERELGPVALSTRMAWGRRAGLPLPAFIGDNCVTGARAEYLRADARAAFTISGARVSLDVLNLGNRRYCDITALPAPGRAAYVGVAWGTGR